ncbi:membrane protein insertase YidC [Methyloradius palustris]|uniref:Membrane protein insertase YidC n=1 Tax=Methyloradius palustris TaxID=2778876 RepID=A0A8E3ZI80_9PROT|nr:membrane protein insertase YidC [Methyloradius palustris]BCM26316.1 membrane protein insertase YidC [Methyloradius palustris]
MDTKRLILFVILSFSILMLWDGWQRQHLPADSGTESTQAQDASVPQVTNGQTPTAALDPNKENAALVQDSGFRLLPGKRVHVETDLFSAEIDTTGGDLRHLELLKHRASDTTDHNFVLMDDTAAPMTYVAQTGLIGTDLPTHKSVFTTAADSYQMEAGKDTLDVRFTWVGSNGVQVDKIYTFHRGDYAIDVNYQIHNGGSTPIEPWVYYQIVHDSQSNQGSKMMPTFTGGAYFTQADKYKKLPFKDMEKSNLSKNTPDGWVGIVQHYFVSAWIPEESKSREFYTKKLSENIYSIGSKGALDTVAPGASIEAKAKFYAGPQTHTDLEKTAPGLELTVDYGILKVIAFPLFWVLSHIEIVVHNWGVAIILLTVLIKLMFYPLSAKSYRSMAQMRELAPRLQRMKEQFGDDKQKMQQAMMELYKTEKINPMGGCLPILVQIPVFISLYWVLLGSVEMRHAPFMLWIHDLSAVDPYYVLPLLMGATMIIQTRLNPAPTDPVQAKVMMIMPIVFSVFFFFFPAGLVLYWLVNNLLSITQQWRINTVIKRETAAKKGNAVK